MTRVKRGTRRREPPVKDRGQPSRRLVPHRSTGGATGEILVRSAGLTDEVEAELAVTRICDLILGRLRELEAREDRDARRERLRRRTG